jgi:hypothetical protein
MFFVLLAGDVAGFNQLYHDEFLQVFDDLSGVCWFPVGGRFQSLSTTPYFCARSDWCALSVLLYVMHSRQTRYSVELEVLPGWLTITLVLQKPMRRDVCR